MRVFQSPTPPLTCFFCLTTLSHPPRNRNSFKCPHCLCWNRYDKDGQIMTDEPAMRDESLNAVSYSKRASPSKHRIPTAYGKGPFCHTCETNQTLLVNLLSNYLPSPEDPSYDARVAELPAYTASLQARYPPVCKDCQPDVDEELRRKESMARTTVLGGWLKQSHRVGSQRTIEKQRDERKVTLWKVRGALWMGGLVFSVLLELAVALRYNIFGGWYMLMMPILVIFSLIWTFWDPTWLSVRNARLQGRTFRVVGRERYIRCQMIIWVSRLITSSLLALQWPNLLADRVTPDHIRRWCIVALAVEVIITTLSLTGLRINRPPTVRLLEPRNARTNISNEPPTSVTPDPEPASSLSSLSLSAHSVMPPINPVFGQPSFPASTAPDVPDEDMMDWTPTKATSDKVQDREGWMRPQRFFPPEQPTGLEDLFEKAKLDTGDHTESITEQQQITTIAGAEMRELAMFFAAAVAIAIIAGFAVYHT